MKIKKEAIIGLVFVIIVAFVFCGFLYLMEHTQRNKPELIIPARGCLFRIETNNTPEFFDEVLVNNRLKIIIDDRTYWIKLEDEINHRFFKDTSTEMRKMP